MTYSIVAADRASGAVGVAVASKALCVGAHVPWGAEGLGAGVATQAFHDLRYGWEGLAELRAGRSAAATVAALTGGDPEAEQRQLGVVDREGRVASYTGSRCLPWAGGMCGAGYAAQGNLLAGPEVIEAMASTYECCDDQAFAPRLVAALLAGDEAGGDRRGRQSAALRIWRGAGTGTASPRPLVDLRVDDAPRPVHRLAELLPVLWLEAGRTDEAAALPFDRAVDRLRIVLGLAPDEDAVVEDAYVAWASETNLERRLLEGRVDAVVLEVLEQGRDAVLQRLARELPPSGWPA